ncbi:hypothetical protein AZI87_01385 [Bdellovibrio bacteriovorus]|uniref:STAS domain-containing protein n=1 Tax=Bdellovibrio bacteriovorus TaxID=959 RepID=A0A162GEH2_BDEBC|nr:hypothetical protein [Bdellovibrio bacteriovorus]KYG67955.1 hypothetical protein AZI87_01385 [Bdellovibrio bacteriovorus]
MALQLSFSVTDKCTTILLKGSLNEYSSALDGVEVNPNFDLSIDLKDLQAINSLGIRNFHNFIQRVRCQRLKLFYCPRVFVNQLNMVEGFLPDKAEIESFFVPYFSEQSGEDAQVLFTKFLEYKKVKDKIVLSIPEMQDSQGNRMDLDVFKDQYFRFLDKYY